MSHWTLIGIACGLTIASTLGLLVWSAVAMRRAEQRADALRRDP